MDPSDNIKGSNSHILLNQYSYYTVLNFNTIIVPPPPPIPNGKDWIININPPSPPPPPPPISTEKDLIINLPPSPPISTGKDLVAAVGKSISLTLLILTTFLQLKYLEPGVENPFKTHPNTMAVALWATLVYFVAGSCQISSPASGWSLPRHCTVWSGNVVVASLASLFAPDLIRPLLYGASVVLCGRRKWHLLCVILRPLILRWKAAQTQC